MKLLGKVPPVTSPRVTQDFAKSFQSQSTSQVLLCEVAWRVGEVAKDDYRAHLIGQSVYDGTAQSPAIVLEETRMTCGKWGKKGLY